MRKSASKPKGERLDTVPVPVPASELPEGVIVGYDICEWRVMVDADGSICTMPAPGTEGHRRLVHGCVDTVHQLRRQRAAAKDTE